MTRYGFGFAAMLIGTSLCMFHGAAAQPVASAPAPPKVEGWDELVKTLGDLPSRMLATLPPTMQNDPQVRQEIARLAMAGFASSALDTLSADGDHPFFLPQLNMILFAGQPNPDTLYRFTAITPGGVYRLRGKLGNIRLFTVGEQPANSVKNGVESPSPIRAYHDFNALKVDAAGRFDVILSPARPDGYKGDWWQLQPDTQRLLLRMVSSDWRGEGQPTISIERVDAPANRPRPSAAEMEQKLRQLPGRASRSASIFVDKVEKLRSEGYVNRFKVFDVSGMGGLAGQFYYEGPYELGDDEALIIEAQAPKTCHYRSVMITNDTYDTTDWYNNHSSLNDSQSKVDSDGVLRIIVSRRDPGVPNWLDTAGHQRGLVQGRWMNCDSQPVPTARRVPVAQVRRFLPSNTPKVSPQERERIIRERRSAMQERPHW